MDKKKIKKYSAIKKQNTSKPLNDYIRAVQDKFKELKDIENKISELKVLYTEHSKIMAELMPLFIDVNADKVTIKREIVIGDKKYRYNPSFLNEGKVISKAWKSTAFGMGSIE